MRGSGWHHSPETKLKLALSNRGQRRSEQTKERQRQAHQQRDPATYLPAIKAAAEFNRGKRRTIETRTKIAIAHKGEKSHFWKGGVTEAHLLIRTTLEYRLWREAVFARDNYTCIWCGDNRGGNLNADHIKPFALFPALRFAIDNGRTLCHDCHKKTDTYGRRSRYR